MTEPAPLGVAVVDKEAGWTSHDVVAVGRGVFGTRKVGHSGTLDPGATGVLVLGVGRATRLLRFLTVLPKTYTTTVVLGTETSTLDDSGEVVANHDMTPVSVEQVRTAAAGFVGDIMQVPPMVSAIKVDGKRLHELAREGIEVERKARPITIHSLDVLEVDAAGASFRIEVECSSGTYIRTLAADMGTALGGGAHLRDLRRTAIGSFTEAEAHPIDKAVILSAAEGLRDYPSVQVNGELATAVGHGKVLSAEQLGATSPGPLRVVAADGTLLAVYEAYGDDTMKPAVVLV